MNENELLNHNNKKEVLNIKMKDSCYLIVSENGIQDMRKQQYSLKLGEIAVKLNFDLPNSLFYKPKVEGNLKVTEDQISSESIIKELEFELKELRKE